MVRLADADPALDRLRVDGGCFARPRPRAVAQLHTGAPWHALPDYGDAEAARRAPCRGAPDGSCPGAADLCVGPVAFAKGPLILLSAAAVHAAVHSPAFARDVARAHAITEGRAPAFAGPGTGRIDDDVQLGYWMSQVPGLHVVSFRRYAAWHDRWKPGVLDRAEQLLAAHKVPWSEYAPLLHRTEGLWSRAVAARTRFRCDGPPCTECAHLDSQLSCSIDVSLLPGTQPAPPATRSKFVHGAEPDVPSQCAP